MTLVKATACQIVLTVSLATAGAAAPHPAVAAKDGCLTAQCHVRLLEGPAGGTYRSVHQPAADGCTSCHDLALAAQARFVKGAPLGAADARESARAWDVVLCTGCHGEGLLAASATEAATRFADGTRNLHALHVQAGRGRRCLTCHDPHAARQPQLLRDRIPAPGKARIAQQFRAETNGGWCKTGCHAPKSYSR